MDIAGEMPGPEYVFLCVVGSRKFDSYGMDACKMIISGLKGYPIVIVSGLAHGIDGMAHRAALEAGLKTISFPGSGLAWNVLYPAFHKQLALDIVEAGGALLSPFKIDQKADFWTFPMRNRLMAGISQATLVIQGNRKSGTLLTAGNASEFSRDILAVPNSIFSELSYVPHMLLRDGAAAISSADDVLRALEFDIDGPSDFKNIAELALSPEEKRIIAVLQISPMSSSDLMETTSLGTSAFSILASQLELKGVIIEEGGLFRMKR